MKKELIYKIAQEKNSAKNALLIGFASFVLFFIFPFLPIDIAGQGILMAFSFASFMSGICTSFEHNKEARYLIEKYNRLF